ncbi:MAG: phenylalanine--tRNA ligase subunit beta [Defluviitaleaceae bacterium]|nr:phenylalanine--tRNA ligase subunit beta [Defluviitaleaceae bacterium]
MNIPINWLKDYVDIDLETDEIAEGLTMSGTKVEAVEYRGKDFRNVVTGKITKIEKHPDADKLVVCQVDIGKGKAVQIVTGATNVAVGDFVPAALDGAILAEGKKIKNSALRGVESQGMLCSIEELGYTKADYPEAPEDGIYIFQNEVELGVCALELLQIKEDIIEFEITGNRPDCFSVIGIGREIAAAFDKKLKYPEITVDEVKGEGAADYVNIEINSPDLCPRYAARVVKNVKIEESPLWLRHKLSCSGIRPVNNIVDITNYVMLELGQPLHAFDLTGVADGKIIVRNAADGEMITTLDGVERKLDSSMLVIADPVKAIAVAGVMGGENSMILGNSAAVIFESANFNGPNIRQTSKKLGIRTDASSKYEKGLDPNISMDALNRCAQLVNLLGCGEVIEGVVDCYPQPRHERQVGFDPARINALLGTNISEKDMYAYLGRLGISAADKKAAIPTFRADLEMEADIAEEIGRIYGYNNIETTLGSGGQTAGKLNQKQHIERLIKTNMTAMGFSEAMGYSFESPKVFDMLRLPADSKLRESAVVRNPLGEDFSVMRTTTLNNMLKSLSTNYNRRVDEAMLFELSKVYLPKALPLTELPDEVDMLSIAFYSKDKKKDFYYLKGVCEAFFEAVGIGNKIQVEPEINLPFMHPGRCAVLSAFGGGIGFLGEVHPEVLKTYEIGQKVYLAAIVCDMIYEKANLTKAYKPLPKYPAITRDIAMVVGDDTLSSQVENIIRKRGGKLLESVKLFDVYKGEQVGEGLKSMAYSIAFRAADKTLTDDEVGEKMETILTSLEKELKANLRDK